MLTLDTAYRNWRGAARDLDAAHHKAVGSRNSWLQTLHEQMAERLEEARELGLDITNSKVLLELGVPCNSCLNIARPRTGHKVFVGGPDSPAVYAECNEAEIDPKTAPMPSWPPIPGKDN